MNQERIGKFIASCRKKQNLTQEKLAERLGVTDKSVSRWENGKTMPDISLFKPLCKELNITINELLSGEKLDGLNYQDKLEENITNAIDLSAKKIEKFNKIISLIVIIFGLFISISAVMIFPSESSWSSIYSIFGIIVFIIGIYRITNLLSLKKRLLLSVIIFFISISFLLITDYINVKRNKEAPMFRIKTSYIGNMIYYDAFFYDVYRCNFNKKNEYWIISKDNKKTEKELINFCK